ncbi:DJ-1/PfpI family protein [Cladophialophora carrionii]|uniref:DJ-1/PfpI family protein n=1 Tax=Cladophialophora carrionii TaxID=86049 RepID=A0A1C1CCY0_9EURO|nr:DJ-1/PfpI family protein [Cladophialophora carrionii]
MAPFHFGALVYDYQAIDVFGPFDLLNSSSQAILQAIRFYAPLDEATVSRAPEFVFHHIGQTLNPVRLLSSSVTIVPTATIDDPPTLDALLIGGPNPAGFTLPTKYAEFIRAHVAAGKPLFTTCTGAAVVAATGVLDGRAATINHVEYNWTRAEFPKVNWTRDRKWVVDGNIWTGSGAVAGMDMLAHWIKVTYGLDVLTLGAMGLDYEPRDIDGAFDTVLKQRYDGSGKRLPAHVFP